MAVLTGRNVKIFVEDSHGEQIDLTTDLVTIEPMNIPTHIIPEPSHPNRVMVHMGDNNFPDEVRIYRDNAIVLEIRNISSFNLFVLPYNLHFKLEFVGRTLSGGIASVDWVILEHSFGLYPLTANLWNTFNNPIDLRMSAEMDPRPLHMDVSEFQLRTDFGPGPDFTAIRTPTDHESSFAGIFTDAFQTPSPYSKGCLRRSRELLEDHLTHKQRKEFKKNDHFTIICSYGRVVISTGLSFPVHIDHNTLGTMSCCLEVWGVPIYDQMLVQKLLIETDVIKFLELSNISYQTRRTQDGLPISWSPEKDFIIQRWFDKKV